MAAPLGRRRLEEAAIIPGDEAVLGVEGAHQRLPRVEPTAQAVGEQQRARAAADDPIGDAYAVTGDGLHGNVVEIERDGERLAMGGGGHGVIVARRIGARRASWRGENGPDQAPDHEQWCDGKQVREPADGRTDCAPYEKGETDRPVLKSRTSPSAQ